jgi:CMP-N,N'-diacetyllegionaminic acid synthase
MKTIAFIPARKGSKGLPGKNKKDFHGKPLIQWSIDHAKNSELFDEIVVSSDDLDILEMAKDSGVAIHKRPEPLADDDAKMDEVLFDYFSRSEHECEHICLLMPTAPLRIVEDIVKMHRFIKMKKYWAVVSVKWTDLISWVDKPTDHKHPMPLYNLDKRPNRQTRDNFFEENGSVYWFMRDALLAYGAMLNNPKKVKLYEMPEERSLEIDTEFGFYMAERAYEYTSMA